MENTQVAVVNNQAQD
jgi:hypothetical protein